jgi:hypothetical protein
MTSLIQWAIKRTFPSFNERTTGFEDILFAISNPDKYALINTLPSSSQHVLIKGTLTAGEEEVFVNEYLHKYIEKPKTIIIYGMNCCDQSVHEKRAQLISLGISDVFVYIGGLFEWLLLQDIYGETEFPTTAKIADLLAYRPKRRGTEGPPFP